ncbi:unnamed protein product [Schistosoma turkestanicum]|nr:unnamed protein product [Schistosoma turkestanicum]
MCIFRLEPPIHIYDTANNIKLNNNNDYKSDPLNHNHEQTTLLFNPIYPPATCTPQTNNICQTTTESSSTIVNQCDDTSLTQLKTTATTTTKYADLSFLPNSSLHNAFLSCNNNPLLLTNTNINTNTTDPNHSNIVQATTSTTATTTTLSNKTIKESSIGKKPQHQHQPQPQQSQQQSVSSVNQHHCTSLSKGTVNCLYDIEISSCSTAYESVIEYTPTCDDITSKQKTVREVYEDAEALYRHLSDLKQSNNSNVQAITNSSTD